jgi:hypothetical protein
MPEADSLSLRVHRETEPNFHLDIQEDVTEECSKYGKVLQCHVVRDSPSGLVYLRFESSEGGTVSPPPRATRPLPFPIAFLKTN